MGIGIGIGIGVSDPPTHPPTHPPTPSPPSLPPLIPHIPPNRCHRDLAAGETLTRVEQALLKVINNIYFLPPWVSPRAYVDLAQKEGLQVCAGQGQAGSGACRPFYPMHAGMHACMYTALASLLSSVSTHPPSQPRRPNEPIPTPQKLNHSFHPAPLSFVGMWKSERQVGGLDGDGQALLAGRPALLLQPTGRQGLPPEPQRPEGRAGHLGEWGREGGGCAGWLGVCLLGAAAAEAALLGWIVLGGTSRGGGGSWLAVSLTLLTRPSYSWSWTVHDAGLQHRAHQVRRHHGREEIVGMESDTHAS